MFIPSANFNSQYFQFIFFTDNRVFCRSALSVKIFENICDDWLFDIWVFQILNSGIRNCNILFLDSGSLLISLRENIDSAQKWSEADMILLVTGKRKFFREFAAGF